LIYYPDIKIKYKKQYSILEKILKREVKESILKKYVDSISMGDLILYNFKIEIGVMDYGFEINGIIGMDFLKSVGAVIDLDKKIVAKSH
jgi:hypothetical protein